MDAIATGHYARIHHREPGSESLISNYRLYNYASNFTGVSLMRAVDSLKDQTYFLCQVTQVYSMIVHTNNKPGFQDCS